MTTAQKPRIRQVITKVNAIGHIKQTKGRFFSAHFIKKDGTLRTMTCRLGVKKYANGRNPEATKKRNQTNELNGIILVFDTAKHDYRSINVNTLKGLVINHIEYTVI